MKPDISWRCLTCGNPMAVPVLRDDVIEFRDFKCIVPSCPAYLKIATGADVDVKYRPTPDSGGSR